MNPNLLEGDMVLVNRMLYNVHIPFTTMSAISLGSPSRGDIIAFESSDEDKIRYVKRVVGVPNDEVEIKRNKIYINGDLLPIAKRAMDLGSLELIDKGFKFSAYWENDAYPVMFVETFNGTDFSSLRERNVIHTVSKFTVPEGKYFVLGDNRDLSKDSRAIGFVDEDKIIGKIIGVAFNYKSFYTDMPFRFNAPINGDKPK